MESYGRLRDCRGGSVFCDSRAKYIDLFGCFWSLVDYIRPEGQYDSSTCFLRSTQLRVRAA